MRAGAWPLRDADRKSDPTSPTCPGLVAGRYLVSKMDKNGQTCYGLHMNVALTPEFEELIRRKLATGLYKNAAEVVREGLRLLAEEDEWKAEVRRKIAEGMAQLRAGQVVDGEQAVHEVVKDLRRRRGKAEGA